MNTALQRARSLIATWIESMVIAAGVYSRLARDTGLAGLLAALQVSRSTRRISEVYGHIENELRMHEEQMAWLRIQLAEAQHDHRVARQAIDNLYQERT